MSYLTKKKKLLLSLIIALIVVVFTCATGALQFGRGLMEHVSGGTGTRFVANGTGFDSAVNNGLRLHRKLLLQRRATQVEQPNRIWGDRCSNSDIVINQGPTDPLPSGIPTYTVEIMNVCTTGCDISGIHLSCGWFSSARLINPRLFRRIRYDDCLVNNGKPLVNGHTISFQYANTFRYPLTVSSVIC
ncbi:hypothetical protein CTI12_AA536870 [Artemisia annua]|uniref:Protein TAPETUM DETERMINANT 1 n=1 Tax=Artemisia annua TaxID=35608 RepID=A0A2U1L372_ARTAN|nr:hypothetical protein CTI12_AA536870 [Artemisia annua]